MINEADIEKKYKESCFIQESVYNEESLYETDEKKIPKIEETKKTDESKNDDLNNENNILIIGDENLSFSEKIIQSYPFSNIYIASSLTEFEMNYILRDLETKTNIKYRTIKNTENNEIENNIQNEIESNIQNEIENTIENEIENNIENEIENDIENGIEKEKDFFYFTKKFKKKYFNRNVNIIFKTNLFSLQSHFPRKCFDTVFLLLPGLCYNINDNGLKYYDKITSIRIYYFIIYLLIELMNVCIKNAYIHILWTNEKLKKIVEEEEKKKKKKKTKKMKKQ